MVKGKKTEMRVQLANHLRTPINHMGDHREAHTVSDYRSGKYQILTHPVTLATQVLPLQASGWMFAKEQRCGTGTLKF